jgi:hypothetical protein
MTKTIENISKEELEEEQIRKIIMDIGAPFEILEKLVSNRPEKMMADYLSGMIVNSLRSPDPARVLFDAIRLLKSEILENRISLYLSISNQQSFVQSKTVFKALVKKSPAYKSQIKPFDH